MRSLKDDYEDIDQAAELFEKLEAGIIALLDGHLYPDDFERLCDAVDGARDLFETDINIHVEQAIERQIDNVRSNIADVDSESTLNDYISALQRFAPRIGVPVSTLNIAIKTVESRISEINGEVEEASAPSVAEERPREKDNFDNTALENLFAPLVTS